MIGQLRELLLQFAGGVIAFGAFRERFVSMSPAADVQPLLGNIYDVIESQCSAYDHQLIDEVTLKARLFTLASQIVIQNFSNVHVVMNPSTVVRYALSRPSANGNVSLESLLAYTSRNSSHEEPELEDTEL